MTSFILHQWAKFHTARFFRPTGEEAATAETAFMLLAA